MKWIDRRLRACRIGRVVRLIPNSCRLLDIGCGDGTLLEKVRERVQTGVGIDPEFESLRSSGSLRFYRGVFPEDLPEDETRFDIVTAAAVLEHIPQEHLLEFAASLASVMTPRGRVIATVPSRHVDRILAVLSRLHAIDGLALEQHHGMEWTEITAALETSGFRLSMHRPFQLGLNNLLVFQRTDVDRREDLPQ